MNNHLVQKNLYYELMSPQWPLVDFINKMYPLTPEIMEFMSSRTAFKKVSKGKFLLKPGEYCKDYYFIHKGILRSYIKYGEKEITIWINPEGEI